MESSKKGEAHSIDFLGTFKVTVIKVTVFSFGIESFSCFIYVSIYFTYQFIRREDKFKCSFTQSQYKVAIFKELN